MLLLKLCRAFCLCFGSGRGGYAMHTMCLESGKNIQYLSSFSIATKAWSWGMFPFVPQKKCYVFFLSFYLYSLLVDASSHKNISSQLLSSWYSKSQASLLLLWSLCLLPSFTTITGGFLETGKSDGTQIPLGLLAGCRQYLQGAWYLLYFLS